MFLVLDSMFELEENENFAEDMIEGVFISTTSATEARSILAIINPVMSNKCAYKPFFVSKKVEGQLQYFSEVVDGYIFDIDEPEAVQLTDDLINYRRQIGLVRTIDRFLSSNIFFIRLCRYLISRQKLVLTPQLVYGSSFGYVIPILNLFYILQMYSLHDYIIFRQSMHEKGYFRAETFISRVNLCPSCLHSHLLYVERCPKCGSSEIESEEVIHHFRCANVSPENTYNFGGQMRCPKCHKILRHIGVDYDRPSTVFSCANCGNTFLDPDVIAICTSCGKETPVTDLATQDITQLSITEEGTRALVSLNAGYILYSDFYDNYMNFNAFINRLRIIYEQASILTSSLNLAVIQIWVINSNTDTMKFREPLISFFCNWFDTNKMAMNNDILYIKEKDYGKNDIKQQTFLEELDKAMEKCAEQLEPGERICYSRCVAEEKGSNAMSRFIKQLNFVEINPDTAMFRQRDPSTV